MWLPIEALGPNLSGIGTGLQKTEQKNAAKAWFS